MRRLDDYKTIDGLKYNTGNMLKDAAGLTNMNAAIYQAFMQGAIEVAPDARAMIEEAERHNAEIDQQLAQIAADMESARLPHRPWRSEWEERDGTDE